MVVNKKNIINNYIYFFSFYILILINICFYILITIPIYKLICLDTNYTFLNIITILYLKNIYILNSYYTIIYNTSNIYYIYINIYIIYTYYFYENLLFLFDISNNYSLILWYNYSNINYINTKYSFLLIYFLTRTSINDILKFECLQDNILLSSIETFLIFFRITNYSLLEIHCISIYIIYPITLISFINKIQCFCFDTIILKSKESLELPIIFYIYTFNETINKIYIYYLLLLVNTIVY